MNTLKREELLTYLANELTIEGDCLKHRAKKFKEPATDFVALKKELIKDCLDYVGLTEGLKLSDLKGNELQNEKNPDGHLYREMAEERADGEVDIYNQDLRESGRAFHEFTEEALTDGLLEMKDVGFEMTKALAAGQYLFYSQLANEILAETQTFLSKQ